MPDEEFTIDELARAAGTTTRSVRLYRERGLLPPPVRMGRLARYDRGHLARLRLVLDLLDRGYSLAAIGEVLAVWQRGGNVGELVGLEEAVSQPWSDERPRWVSLEELVELFPVLDVSPEDLRRAVDLGLIAPEGNGFWITSMKLLRAAAELVAAGVDNSAVLDQAAALMGDMERVAHRYVDLAVEHVFEPFLRAGMPAEDVPRVRELVERLRPVAIDTVNAALALALDRAVADRISGLANNLPDLEASA